MAGMPRHYPGSIRHRSRWSDMAEQDVRSRSPGGCEGIPPTSLILLHLRITAVQAQNIAAFVSLW